MDWSVSGWKRVLCLGALCLGVCFGNTALGQTSGGAATSASTSSAKTPTTPSAPERTDVEKKRDAKVQEALLLARRKKIDEAIKILEEVIQAEPAHVPGAVELARNYMIQRRKEDAEKTLVQAIKADPKRDTFYYYLTVHHQNLGDAEKANEALAQGLKENPKSRVLYVLQGQRLSSKDPEKAAEAYRKALEVEPTNRTALNNLAVLYIDANRFRDAEKVLEDYVKYVKRGASGRFNLGLVYGKLGKHKEALALYEGLLKQRPTDQFAMSGVVLTHALSGDFAKAKDALAPFRDVSKMPPRIAYSAGLVALFEGDTKMAQALANRAVEGDQTNVYANLLSAEVARRLKDLKAADDVLSKQLKRKPQEPMTKAYLSLVRHDQGRMEEAKKLLAEAIAAHKDYSALKDLKGLLRLDDTALDVVKKIQAASAANTPQNPAGETGNGQPKAKSSGCGCVQAAHDPSSSLWGLLGALGVGVVVWRRRRSS